MLTALVSAALLAGLAGAWSPCGFSMVDTLAPSGYAGRVRTTLAASLAFAAGALAGGIATFGGLGLLGAALGLGGGVAVSLAAAGLVAAAIGDGAGRRIVPQVRRQVPESWRRRLPVPIAAGLYGVLLGLGFTTFVLSFATWALAIACLALGDWAVGVAVGVAFGVGRALPVIVLAPLRDHAAGARAAAAMAERPAILRALRASAAAALVAGALVIALGGASAAAAERLSNDAGDPSAAGDALAWEASGDRGLLRRGAAPAVQLPGSDPAVGPDRVAWREANRLVVARLDTLEPVFSLDAAGADELAVSATHLAWRSHQTGGPDRIQIVDLAAPGATPLTIAQAPAGTLGRPALDGTRVVYHLAGRLSGSRLVEYDIATGRARFLRRERRALLLNPSLAGDRLVFVRSTRRRQQLIVGTRERGSDRAVYGIAPTGRRDTGAEAGHKRHREGYRSGRAPALPARPKPGVTRSLWTTALAGGTAYVTRLRSPRSGGGPARASLLRVPLG